MRSTALTLAASLALVFATAAGVGAQDDDLGDLGVRRRPGQAPPEPPVSYAKVGPYGIIAGTLAADDFHDRLGGGVDNSLGFNLRGGYRWHPNLAAELEYEWLDEFKGRSGSGVDVEGWALMLNGKAFLGSGRVAPFLIAGIGIIHGENSGAADDIDKTEFGVKGGGGLEIYLTQNVALNTEVTYNFATEKLDDFKYTSFTWGVMFRP